MTVRLELDVPPSPLRRSTGAIISVTLTNDGPEPVLVNRRMAPGYADSVSREIYFDLNTSYGKQKYERDPAGPTDYLWLQASDSVSSSIDLLAWYRVRNPGTYRLTAHYQGDEPTAKVPDGILRGVISSTDRTVNVE